jgi:hypothetical protein
LTDDEPLRLVVIRSGDLSPDSGVVIQYEPTPSPSVAYDPVRPTTLPAQRAQPPKTLPIIYGTYIHREKTVNQVPLVFLQLLGVSFVLF